MKVFGQLEKAQLENGTADLTGVGTGKGYIIYRTDLLFPRVYNGTAWSSLVDDTTAQTLTNKALTSPNLTTGYITSGLDLKEETSLSSPAAGARRLGLKTDGKLYLRDSSGVEKIIGEGGAAGINYVLNPDAETNTTGWVTYLNTAQATPVTGTGGSPTVTWTRSTSSPLRKTGSFLFTKSAVNSQGQGVSYDFTIDSADQGRVLSGSFDYVVASGTYAPGDMTVYLYDVTNAQIIQPTGFTLNGASTGFNLKHPFTFQSNSNSTSYRLIFHVASASALAYTVKVDNVLVGPQVIAQGTPVIDWTSYTPIITYGTGGATNVTVSGKWRRVGDTMFIKGAMEFSSTSAAFSGITVSLPSFVTIDTTKFPGTTGASARSQVGSSSTWRNGVQWYPGMAQFVSATTFGIYAMQTASSAANPVTVSAATYSNTSPTTYTTSDTITWEASFPIVGWSSNVEMSSDTDTRVCAAKYTVSGTRTPTTSKAINYDTKVFDTHGAVTTVAGDVAGWRFTAPLPGLYRVSIISLTSATGSASLIIYRGGVQDTALTSNAAAVPYGASTVLSMQAGEYIDIRSDGTPTMGSQSIFNNISIDRISGPSQIARNETISCSYSNTSLTTFPAATNTTVPYIVKDHDTHGAYNTTTGVYTVQAAGIYRLQATAILTGAATTVGTDNEMGIAKNGSVVRGTASRTDSTSTASRNISIDTALSLIAGDTIAFQVYSGETSPTLNAGAIYNFMSITRIG